jgi:hypothetical protein
LRKKRSPIRFHQCGGFARQESLLDRSTQVSGDRIILHHQPIAAIAEIGEHDRGLAVASRGRIELFKQVRIHQPTRSTIDLNLAAAGEPDPPGGLVGDAELEHLRPRRWRSHRRLPKSPRPRRSRRIPIR